MGSKYEYPAPTVAAEPRQKSKLESHVVTFGRRAAVLVDGRPALVEDWFDIETDTMLRSVVFSVFGAESYAPGDHLAYLTRSGIIDDLRPKPLGSVGIKRFTDDAGEEMWSVTVVLAVAE